MKINLNDSVKFKVWPKGEKAWKEKGWDRVPDKDGYFKTSLWDFMRIFGSEMSMGFNPPVSPDLILIQD